MANNQKKLKAFVRYDGSGRVVASSLILRKNKPRVGRWYQIPEYLCCNGTSPSTTTTTTTSGGGGGTPTAWMGYVSTSTYNSCNEIGGYPVILYTSTPYIGYDTIFYVDAALTTRFTPGSYNFLTIGTDSYVLYGDGSVVLIFYCSNFPTTTTTTTTVAPTTTTTTTTSELNCFCYTINNQTAGLLDYTYTDCGSEVPTSTSIEADTISIVCSSTAVTGDDGLIITGGTLSCNNSEGCTV